MMELADKILVTPGHQPDAPAQEGVMLALRWRVRLVSPGSHTQSECVRFCFAAVRRTACGCAPRGSANRRETDTTNRTMDKAIGFRHFFLECGVQPPHVTIHDLNRR